MNICRTHCEDCGERMYGGFCTNCDEEHFIAEQYRELGESIPESIAAKERDQIERRLCDREKARHSFSGVV